MIEILFMLVHISLRPELPIFYPKIMIPFLRNQAIAWSMLLQNLVSDLIAEIIVNLVKVSMLNQTIFLETYTLASNVY